MDVPSTDDVRDTWVDSLLNSLPRADGIALVPVYQQLFDAWLDQVCADERERIALAVEAWGTPEMARRVAAWIARTGGSDE